ncbi:MAG: NAD+ synthase, partial [Parachlamydiaceae bacterium]|nr:NAD+ synthase [Parachlamydiaceae bacterium]
MRILIAQINPIVGDLKGNVEKHLRSIAHARKESAQLVVFPELSLTGYPPQDLLLLPHFIDEVSRQLRVIVEATEGIAVILGLPRESDRNSEKGLYNSAAIISDKKILGYQDKTLLPTYDVFDERRYFEPSSSIGLWEICHQKVAVTICEDIWQHSNTLKDSRYQRDPVVELAVQAPDFAVNLSASPYSVAKFGYRLEVCSKAAATLRCPLIFCNQVGGNDSLIFDGYSLYLNGRGELCDWGKGFAMDDKIIDLNNATPASFAPTPQQELYSALVLGLRDYFLKSRFTKACLGLSGGIDSALVACIAKEALGKENVLGISMPSRFSSTGSITDARQLAENLGIQYREIPIEEPFKSYLGLLSTPFEGKAADTTEENLQSRIRGMILMAMSNKFGYITLSTGNKSELAVGYATLYGDMCGGLGVISDVTKNQVYALSNWINKDKEIIPWNTIRKPPSAELREGQMDSDSLPPYDVLDNVLIAYVEDHLSAGHI